jgi:YggT family protein
VATGDQYYGESTLVGASYPLLTFWYLHLPNYVLAVLMYTLLGRVLLGLIVEPDSQNYIWRFFCRITDPVVALVSLVTPKAAIPVVVWLFGVVWLFWLRIGLLYLFLILGAVPRTN